MFEIVLKEEVWRVWGFEIVRRFEMFEGLNVWRGGEWFNGLCGVGVTGVLSSFHQPPPSPRLERVDRQVGVREQPGREVIRIDRVTIDRVTSKTGGCNFNDGSALNWNSHPVNISRSLVPWTELVTRSISAARSPLHSKVACLPFRQLEAWSLWLAA